MKEIRIPHREIRDPQTITKRNVRAFTEAGLDIHRHEVESIDDDFSRGERCLKVRDRKLFGPWSKRGR